MAKRWTFIIAPNLMIAEPTNAAIVNKQHSYPQILWITVWPSRDKHG